MWCEGDPSCVVVEAGYGQGAGQAGAGDGDGHMVRRRQRIEKWKEEKRKELDTSAGKDEVSEHFF